MKKFMAVLMLILLVFVISGCSGSNGKSGNRVTNAIIRYFDGTGEMLLVEKYELTSGGSAMHIWTPGGGEIIVGVNNVLLVTEDEEDQFNHE